MARLITLSLSGPELEALRTALCDIMEGVMPNGDDPDLQSIHDYLMDV